MSVRVAGSMLPKPIITQSQNTPAMANTFVSAPPARRRMKLSATTAVLMLAAVVLAWVCMAMPDAAAGRFGLITPHKPIGETTLCLAVFRLVWRLHPLPAMSGRLARWEVQSARWYYLLL